LDPDSTGFVDPDPTKKEKVKKISCFEELHVLFEGLKASPLVTKSFIKA
jgi:hypothetical protein